MPWVINIKKRIKIKIRIFQACQHRRDNCKKIIQFCTKIDFYFIMYLNLIFKFLPLEAAFEDKINQRPFFICIVNNYIRNRLPYYHKILYLRITELFV